MPLQLRCVPFNEPNFWAEVRQASGVPSDVEPDQLRYLAAYLQSPALSRSANGDRIERTLIVEQPYVDRHYLEEYTGYYASTLHPPDHKTTRIHVLDIRLNDQELARRLERAQHDYEAVRQQLEEAYLGFIVIRPLPSAPVGRTILRAYRDRPSRCFAPASTRHRVHLAGLEIEVEGMPFQQQDQAVGACATTALWSALARVTRADGGRAVTPLAVTQAATRYLISGRPLPADGGLDMNQTLGAIREMGYSPYVLAVVTIRRT